jgi:SAM-dependent methyltransferase
MRVDDVPALVEDLKTYRSDWENAETRAQLVDTALPRILAMLALVPEGRPESRLLELGAAPFFTTLCLDRLWPGRLTLAGYTNTGERKGVQRLVSLEGKPDKVYEYDIFNVEVDEFPYADASFDVVVFSELIEHLALNPVWTLAEIHRVLKPEGHVVITTPNALSLERLETYLYGGSEMVDRYAPLMGYGARHNREYHPAELRELLEATGFTIEEMVVRDLGHYGRRTRLRRWLRKRLLRLWSRHPRDSHVFLRARRGPVFRWRFPSSLYEHMEMYQLVRHPFLEMGVNDTIQCGPGWLGLEEAAGGEGPVRRINGDYVHANWMDGATGFLRAGGAACGLVVRLRGEGNGGRVSGLVRVRPRHGEEVLARHPFEVDAGRWVDLSVPLARSTSAGEELEVEIDLAETLEVAVRRIGLAP